MIDMMASQEKTLESMFQAYDSLCKYLQTTDASLDHVSDTVSVLSLMTNMTTSTANDFESVIKSTAVYQRCIRRRGDDNGLSSLETLMAPPFGVRASHKGNSFHNMVWLGRHLESVNWMRSALISG
jgi:hypothetical protein